MPVIDSHVHFYDSTRPEGIVWPPPESPLYGQAFQKDFKQYSSPVEVEGVIIVEASPRAIDDAWILELAEKDPFVLGVVANLQAAESGLPGRIDEYKSKYSKLRGIRLRPIVNFDLDCSDLRRRLAALHEKRMTFELGATSLEILNNYAELASHVGDAQCILDHFGHPKIDGKAPPKDWSEAMSRYAALPNTICKITSLIEFSAECPAPTSLEFYRPLLDFLFEKFGEDRIVYGSNWPPISLAGSYETNFALYRDYIGDNQILADKFFHQNAKRIYHLDT